MKTIKPTLLAVLTAILLLLNNTDAEAQFEQKVTLQAAGGYVEAIAPEMFKIIFHNGFSFDAGTQYNFSRTTSLLVHMKYSTFVSHVPSHPDANYNLVGISLCPKFRFLPHAGVNPYIYGGGTFNYYRIIHADNLIMDWKTQFGFTGGLGADIPLTDNFAIFFQGGINGVNHPEEMLMHWYTQLGINISIFKSRTL